jgi:hypothetical protein
MREPSLAGTKLTYYHVCAFFNSREEEYGVLGPFFKEGLEWGEKSVHIVDPALQKDHLARLHACGIDTESCQHSGQLEVLPWDSAYVQDGAFDRYRMLKTVEDVFAAGRAAGFRSVRIMGNMGWALDTNPRADEVIEYEARVNEVLARNHHPAVCVYDIARLSGTMMMDILRSHPLTLIGGVVHQNPLFTPPEELLLELHRRRERTASTMQ